MTIVSSLNSKDHSPATFKLRKPLKTLLSITCGLLTGLLTTDHSHILRLMGSKYKLAVEY